MPKIRTIKPDVTRSEDVAEMSITAQLMWERLWCYCDDYGRMKANPSMLKADIFPLVDSITAKDCVGYLEEIEAAGLVEVYEVDGRRYLHVCKWDIHQKISHPNDSVLPAPPSSQASQPSFSDASRKNSDASRKNSDASRKNSDASRKNSDASRKNSDGKGREGNKEKERKGKDTDTAHADDGSGDRARYIPSDSPVPGTVAANPPTVDEVAAYASTLGHKDFDATNFVDYYASQGWLIKQGVPMTDWHPKLRNWLQGDRQRQRAPAVGPGGSVGTNDERNGEDYGRFSF